MQNQGKIKPSGWPELSENRCARTSSHLVAAQRIWSKIIHSSPLYELQLIWWAFANNSMTRHQYSLRVQWLLDHPLGHIIRRPKGWLSHFRKPLFQNEFEHVTTNLPAALHLLCFRRRRREWLLRRRRHRHNRLRILESIYCVLDRHLDPLLVCTTEVSQISSHTAVR